MHESLQQSANQSKMMETSGNGRRLSSALIGFQRFGTKLQVGPSHCVIRAAFPPPRSFCPCPQGYRYVFARERLRANGSDRPVGCRLRRMDIVTLYATPVIGEPTAPSFVLRDGDREVVGRLIVGELIPSLEPPLKCIRQGR